jgi:H+/gluconate symporter-like permease
VAVSEPPVAIALLPLATVAVLNLLLAYWIRGASGKFELSAHVPNAEKIDIARLVAVWSVEGALLAAILLVLPFALSRSRKLIPAGVNTATGGAMLAAMNVASEYGFGAVVAALPGFHAIQSALSHAISNPLLNVAVTTNVLAAVTGSSSGGLSLALAAMGESYLDTARGAGIPPEVLHRVAAMASGGMDTLPHNGAIITLLAITGLTHRQAYKEIFAMTGIKVAAVLIAIAFYALFHLA